MAPLIVVSSDGSRRTAIAGLGARRIISATAQAVENRIDHRLELQEAIDLPRVHADTVEVLVDERIPSEVVDAMERLGWPVRREHYGPTTAGMARLMAVERDRRRDKHRGDRPSVAGDVAIWGGVAVTRTGPTGPHLALTFDVDGPNNWIGSLGSLHARRRISRRVRADRRAPRAGPA